MLLALRNDKGTIATSFSEHAVAGAVLAELLVTKHIKIFDDKKGMLDVISRKPLAGRPKNSGFPTGRHYSAGKALRFPA